MIKTHTDIEQAKALIEKGLDKNTADYCFPIERPHKDVTVRCMQPIPLVGRISDELMPCWSTTRLMALLPSDIEINSNSRRRKKFALSVEKYERRRYNVAYYRTNYISEEIEVLHEETEEQVVDSLVNTILWVLDNGFEDKELIKEIIDEE